MRLQASATILACLATVTLAKKCQDITVAVNISSRNGVFDLKAPATNIDVTNFMLNLGQQGHNYSNALLKDYATVSGTYNLAATYCEPDAGPGKTVQLLTHGIGFDKGYWDFPANDYNYSYVKVAVDDYGYSTFAWDRLGVGASAHGEPVNEIQSWLEVAALRALTGMLRGGKMAGAKHGGFEKVVHVGHSFGSIQSYTLAVMEPTASDGLVLTGFAQNGSFVPWFFFGGDFVVPSSIPALAHYPAGYMAAGNPSAAHTNFFAPGAFDPAILEAAYKAGKPHTVGELLTLGAATGTPSPFKGPVLIITGNRDNPFCGGDCLNTGDPKLASILDSSKKMFPAAKKFETFVVPGAGHGLNLEYSHPLTYKTKLDFLDQNVGK